MWELGYREGWGPNNRCFQIVVLEKTLESLLDSKTIKPVNSQGNQLWIFHWKEWCWSWSCKTLATWCEELTHWKRPWGYERLKAKGEAGDRGWDGCRASPTQWTWIWANSRRQWRTGLPGMPQFMGSQSQAQLGDWETTAKVTSWFHIVWVTSTHLCFLKTPVIILGSPNLLPREICRLMPIWKSSTCTLNSAEISHYSCVLSSGSNI